MTTTDTIDLTGPLTTMFSSVTTMFQDNLGIILGAAGTIFAVSLVIGIAMRLFRKVAD